MNTWKPGALGGFFKNSDVLISSDATYQLKYDKEGKYGKKGSLVLLHKENPVWHQQTPLCVMMTQSGNFEVWGPMFEEAEGPRPNHIYLSKTKGTENYLSLDPDGLYVCDKNGARLHTIYSGANG